MEYKMRLKYRIRLWFWDLLLTVVNSKIMVRFCTWCEKQVEKFEKKEV